MARFNGRCQIFQVGAGLKSVAMDIHVIACIFSSPGSEKNAFKVLKIYEKKKTWNEMR